MTGTFDPNNPVVVSIYDVEKPNYQAVSPESDQFIFPSVIQTLHTCSWSYVSRHVCFCVSAGFPNNRRYVHSPQWDRPEPFSSVVPAASLRCWCLHPALGLNNTPITAYRLWRHLGVNTDVSKNWQVGANPQIGECRQAWRVSRYTNRVRAICRACKRRKLQTPPGDFQCL